MRRITSALFLDFDNIVGRLVKDDRRAAMAWLSQPGSLVEALRSLDEHAGTTRDVLVRRVYLSPTRTVPGAQSTADDASSDRLPVSQYRGALTRAGFEVIDCPKLTKQHKNGADIRMAIDVMDLLAGPVRYDEVIIASSDSDFTPLLFRLRAADRKTMLLTTGDVAVACDSIADRCIEQSTLMASIVPAETKSLSAEDQARMALMGLVNASDRAVSLSTVGKVVREEVGTEIVTETKWFGQRTLTRFVQERVTHLAVDSSSVWDPAHHHRPLAAAS